MSKKIAKNPAVYLGIAQDDALVTNLIRQITRVDWSLRSCRHVDHLLGDLPHHACDVIIINSAFVNWTMVELREFCKRVRRQFKKDAPPVVFICDGDEYRKAAKKAGAARCVVCEGGSSHQDAVVTLQFVRDVLS